MEEVSMGGGGDGLEREEGDHGRVKEGGGAVGGDHGRRREGATMGEDGSVALWEK
jgi:hypothetical protein